MKKLFPFMIAAFCLLAVAVPVFAAQADTAEAASGEILSVGMLDGATSSDTPDPTPAQDSSASDITFNYLYVQGAGSDAPIVRADGNVITDSATAERNNNFTFTVENDSACRLYRGDVSSSGTMTAAKTGTDGVYSYTITSCSSRETVTIGVAGDVDSNGVVDWDDYYALKMFLTSGTVNESTGALMADVNGDGKINTTDLTAIKAQLTKKRSVPW